MLNRSKAWAVGLITAVFAAGMAVGWAADEWTDRDGRRRRSRGTEAMVTYLDRKLDFTPAQRESVRAVFQRRRVEVRALWRTIRPQLDSLRQAMHTDIAALLDESQRARYLQLLAEKEHRDRRKRRNADTGKRE
jgi:Spy/CpxP family protein refolding chaperone